MRSGTVARMTFDDLPADWPVRSLADPVLAADVLDLFVTDRDRDVGGFSVLWCDADGRLLQPVMITGGTALGEQRADDPVLRHAVHLCRDGPETARGCVEDPVQDRGAPSTPRRGGGTGSLVLAIVRSGGPLVDAERAWHQRALARCRAARVPLMSVHLVTHGGVRLLPGPMGPLDPRQKPGQSRSTDIGS